MNEMAKPYSMDIRNRVIQKHYEGKSMIEIARELSVKKTFVYDMLELYRKTGSVEPKPHTGGRKPTIDDELLSQIEALVIETPDITLQEIKDVLGLTISISIICDAINKKLNLRLKKKHYSIPDKTMKKYKKLVKPGETIKTKWMEQASFSLTKAV
jgi:transposase